MNIASDGGNRKHLFTVAPFTRKFKVIGPFMSQNIVSMTICTWNFFFYQRVSEFSLLGLSFQLRLVVENLCLANL